MGRAGLEFKVAVVNVMPDFQQALTFTDHLGFCRILLKPVETSVSFVRY
jgi:hypothetical protein